MEIKRKMITEIKTISIFCFINAMMYHFQYKFCYEVTQSYAVTSVFGHRNHTA